MAVKQLDLVINTSRGEQNLKKLHQFAKQVEQLFGDINKLKINVKTDPAQQALEKLNAEIKEGQDLINKFSQGAGLNAFGSKISAITQEVSLIKKAFNDATSAIERKKAATAILAGDFKKLTLEATAFAKATDSRGKKVSMIGNVGETIKEIEKFPKTILAGKNALNILNNMLEVTNVKSKDFEQITDAITKQLQKNAEIEEKIPKFISKKNQKQQKQNDLEKENNRFKKRKNALNEQTQNIENRINQSIITKAKKEELINNLKRVGVKIDARELDLARQINIETQRNLTMEEKLQSRRDRVRQSALIGGGFPLLFGGGPLQAAAGALGGGIGERISPGGGFAGSIAATAAISKIQEFVNAAREVGNALKDANLGLEKLEEMGFKVDKVTKKQVETLLELGKVREAENLVNQKFAEIIGPEAVKNLQSLDTAFDELDREVSKLFLSLSGELSPAFTTIIDFTTKLVKLLNLLPLKEISSLINPIYRVLNLSDSINEINETRKANTVMDFGLAVAGIKPLNKPNLEEKTDLSTGLTEGGDGTSGRSGNRKDFSQFELNILNQRIELQKLSGGLLNKEVVNRKRGIIHAEAALKFAHAEGDIGKNKIINAERLLKLNQLDLEVEKAKGKAFAENVLKPQMDAIAKKEEEDFNAGAALGKRLAAEIRIINNLDKEIQKMKLLTELDEAKTIEEKANIQLKLYEVDLGQEIHKVNKDDLLTLIRKKLEIGETNDLLDKQKEIVKEIKRTFAVEMSNAIKGLITGTMTLNQALSNVLNKLADAFLNLGLFGNLAGNLEKGSGLLGKIFSGFLADGGPAKAGRSYIVGERGPEMFTPGVSGMVTPNHALGGSTNVTVNVDASGSSVEGDETQAEQLGQAISQAIQAELIQQQRPGGLLYS